MHDVIVSLSSLRYRVDRSWVHAHGDGFSGVSRVAVGLDDLVYVLQQGTPNLLVFDTQGVLVRKWHGDDIVDPHGIFVKSTGDLLIVDRDGHSVFQLHGTEGTRVLGDPAHPRFRDPFNHPTDVAVSPSGDVFVADGYGNARVHRFNSSGGLITSWGEPGCEPGQFATPHGLWIDKDGSRILVADRENDRIQIFAESGDLLDTWRNVFHPMDIHGDKDGNFFVTDQVPGVAMFTGDGRLVGRCKPVPIGAHGVSGDSSGNLYLAEGAPVNRVTRLERIH